MVDCCHIWHSEVVTRQVGTASSPLFVVQNVTTHPSSRCSRNRHFKKTNVCLCKNTRYCWPYESNFFPGGHYEGLSITAGHSGGKWKQADDGKYAMGEQTVTAQPAKNASTDVLLLPFETTATHMRRDQKSRQNRALFGPCENLGERLLKCLS